MREELEKKTREEKNPLWIMTQKWMDAQKDDFPSRWVDALAKRSFKFWIEVGIGGGEMG